MVKWLPTDQMQATLFGWISCNQLLTSRAGRRPALDLSPCVFNELTRRIACPITRRDRDLSFHEPIPDGHDVSGVGASRSIAQRLLETASRGGKRERPTPK
jgi:hypothetical protein